MSPNRIVNDFSITVGTANGSGSSTANTTLLRALFKMGIPVSGKNLFPSNIQGLPTWYTIRVNGEGFVARREEHEIVVAMNPTSFVRDLADVTPGGAFFYADDIKLPINRDDISLYPMPVKELVRSDPAIPSNLRDLVANMVYVGILAQMIGIDQSKIEMALNFHFKNKEKPVSLNMSMVKAGAAWAAANLTKTDPYFVEPLSKTNGMIMADGNTAGALGSIYGGVQFVGWYPITPASSLAEGLNEYLPQLRQAEDGKNTFAVVQAEDELAAIGMCVGAGWAGLRALTSTSGPGMSLMTEYAGLAYFAEVPIVIWDVQRMGPSTGLPTRTSQGDLAFVANMGHGDIDSLILLPGSVNECFEFGWRAFDIAERLQTPVYVLSDLDFGMNQWMTEPFTYPDTPMDRGKVLWEEDLEKIGANWGRYKDVDGDAIPYRTLPGNTHPLSAYFTRGTGHTPEARYSEEPDVWITNMERLKQKYVTAKQYLPKPIVRSTKGASFGIIAYGSTEPAVEEARAQLEKDHNQKSDYLRLRAMPFTSEVGEFIQSHEHIYVVELNRDGQLQQLLTIKYPEYATRLIPIAFNDGLPPTAKWIRTAILEKEEN
ncbi:MAG: 2-oxoacid:acceptor oxidoreductase subunit alpha [Chloroflexi bacterium HGW-Chloroflexi-6]|nr:MAG: 2-oxoacid:acceptor oxidoreductase subunit alpha [Chloroflexi bacterium HGW-Chloroflexi-6]